MGGNYDFSALVWDHGGVDRDERGVVLALCGGLWDGSRSGSGDCDCLCVSTFCTFWGWLESGFVVEGPQREMAIGF